MTATTPTKQAYCERQKFAAAGEPFVTERPFAAIGARLRWHRELTGLSQKDYAATIGAKRPVYSMWESGSARVSIDAAMAIEDRHGLSLDFLYIGRDDALPLALRMAWQESRSRDAR